MFLLLCPLPVEFVVSNGHDIGSGPSDTGGRGDLGVVEIDHFGG